MDPLDFRLLNGSKEGTRRVPGPMYPAIGFMETAQAAKEHDHWFSTLEGPNRGRGVAAGFWFNGAGPSSALANVTADGTVTLIEGSPDIGGSRTVAAMHVAEVLGIAAEDVLPQVGDTNSIGFTSMTGGSGVAFKTGWASAVRPVTCCPRACVRIRSSASTWPLMTPTMQRTARRR